MIKVIVIIGCCIITAAYILAVVACIKMRHEDRWLD